MKKSKGKKVYFEPTLPPNPFFLEEVLDWDKRCAGYSAEIKARYARGHMSMNHFLALLAEDP